MLFWPARGVKGSLLPSPADAHDRARAMPLFSYLGSKWKMPSCGPIRLLYQGMMDITARLRYPKNNLIIYWRIVLDFNQQWKVKNIFLILKHPSLKSK